MGRSGFEVVGEVASAADAVVAVELASPDALVLDLALTGALGLGILAAVGAAAPGCAVVLLSSFDGMRRVALEAGAYEVVASSDLRGLERALRRLGEQVREAPNGEEAGPAAAPAATAAAASAATPGAAPGVLAVVAGGAQLPLVASSSDATTRDGSRTTNAASS